jgi:hypothetical protein
MYGDRLGGAPSLRSRHVFVARPQLWGATATAAADTLGDHCIQFLWKHLLLCADVSFVRGRGGEQIQPPDRAADSENGTHVVGSASLVGFALGLHDPDVRLTAVQLTLVQMVAQVRPAMWVEGGISINLR